ncbi:MAG: DUF4440 domain-containing protein [Rhodospirillaceae bacterium]|nr:DUF4440 domain-containing protein [Rhodospirillaceae bacterium]
MKIKLALILYLLAVYSPYAQTIISGASQADVDVLMARKAAVIEAYNDSDIEALAANYTEDAWHISPRREPAVGRAAIAAFFAPAMPAYIMRSNPTLLSVDIAGDIAVMISANELGGAPRPGAPGTKSGRDGQPPPAFTEKRTNLTVFKKQPDGRWLIHRFIDTTQPEDRPPAPDTK